MTRTRQTDRMATEEGVAIFKPIFKNSAYSPSFREKQPICGDSALK